MLIKIDHAFHDRLTDTEKNVINFINSNVKEIANMSISDVADSTFSSPATVSRTIKKCGISGFAELRYLITQQNKMQQSSADVNEVLRKSLNEVTNTIDMLSTDTVLKIIKEIRNADKIYILSRGLTIAVANELTLKLQLLGYWVFQNSDAAIMQEITNNMKRKDLLIVLSMSGKTPELISAAENAASVGAHIVAITCSSVESPLTAMATISMEGYKHQHVTFRNLDVASRLPLFVMTRILIDYLMIQHQEEAAKLAEKQAQKNPNKLYI